jgi:hypothetical protein
VTGSRTGSWKRVGELPATVVELGKQLRGDANITGLVANAPT